MPFCPWVSCGHYSAAKLLSWAIAEQEIHGLLAEARELNEASANPESQPGEPEAPNLRDLPVQRDLDS